MKNLVIVLTTFLFIGALQTSAIGQNTEVNTWKILAMVTMQKVFDEKMGIDVEKPTFSKSVQKLNDTEITIKGYILPLKASKDQKYFILSAYPYNMCYFCGGAGPESVMEVYSTKPVEMTQTMVKLKGTLRVNFNPSIGQVLYTLKNAEVVK
jgi:hypothetical protein